MIRFLTAATERTRAPFFAFLLGAAEFRRDCTWADPARDEEGDGLTNLDDAYDWGREWTHRLTFRALEA